MAGKSQNTWVSVRRVPGRYGRYQAMVRHPDGTTTLLADPEALSEACLRAWHELETAYQEPGPAHEWPALPQESRRAG